jgi:hypothetical protein
VPILQSWFLLLIFKLTFKWVSQWMHTESVLYFVCSIPLNTVPYPFTFHPPFLNSFQYISLFPLCSHLVVCNIYWCCISLFFFLSFSKFHRVVPLLETCSTSEFVYDHACFCAYIYLWIYCVSDHGYLSLSWRPPIASTYLQILCHYSLW